MSDIEIVYDSRPVQNKSMPVKRKASFMMEDLLRHTHDVKKDSCRAAENSTSLQSSPSPVRTTGQQSGSPSQSGSETESSQDRESLSPASQSPVARKKNRPTFSPHKVQQLTMVFARERYLKPKQRKQLALDLNMTDDQVKTWFQNKRMKLKRKLAESEQRHAKLDYLTSLANQMSSPQQPSVHAYHSPVYGWRSPLSMSSCQELPGLWRSPPSPVYQECLGYEYSVPAEYAPRLGLSPSLSFAPRPSTYPPAYYTEYY